MATEKCGAHDLLIDEVKNLRDDVRSFRSEFRTAVDSLVIQREAMAEQKAHTSNISRLFAIVFSAITAIAGWLWAHVAGK